MLEMKKKCELCGCAVAPDELAWICSYKCTYCDSCNQQMSQCPNCAGELVPRPKRTTGAVEIATRLPKRIARRLRRSA